MPRDTDAADVMAPQNPMDSAMNRLLLPVVFAVGLAVAPVEVGAVQSCGACIADARRLCQSEMRRKYVSGGPALVNHEIPHG